LIEHYKQSEVSVNEQIINSEIPKETRRENMRKLLSDKMEIWDEVISVAELGSVYGDYTQDGIDEFRVFADADRDAHLINIYNFINGSDPVIITDDRFENIKKSLSSPATFHIRQGAYEGGAPIALGLAVCTVLEYAVYIIVILLLLYLCFRLFAITPRVRPASEIYPMPDQRHYTEPGGGGGQRYTEMGGCREMNSGN
jgi:hypothetical protein